jgi:hypothetical protein
VATHGPVPCPVVHVPWLAPFFGAKRHLSPSRRRTAEQWLRNWIKSDSPTPALSSFPRQFDDPLHSYGSGSAYHLPDALPILHSTRPSVAGEPLPLTPPWRIACPPALPLPWRLRSIEPVLCRAVWLTSTLFSCSFNSFSFFFLFSFRREGHPLPTGKMHTVQKITLGLLAAAAVASASDVTQLKTDSFDEFIKTNDIVLAECAFSLPSPNGAPR